MTGVATLRLGLPAVPVSRHSSGSDVGVCGWHRSRDWGVVVAGRLPLMLFDARGVAGGRAVALHSDI